MRRERRLRQGKRESNPPIRQRQPNGWGIQLEWPGDATFHKSLTRSTDPSAESRLEDSVVSDDLHEVLVGEVEEDLEVSRIGAGVAGVDEES